MEWWRRISLRTRLFLLLTALTLLILGGGLTTFWYTSQMRDMVLSLIDRNVAALQTAYELEVSLVNQKGLATYYALSGDPDWLDQLEEQRRHFEVWLRRAKEHTTKGAVGNTLDQIASEYREYVAIRNQVIDLYKRGKREKGEELHWRARSRFSKIYMLCKEFKHSHQQDIIHTREKSLTRARHLGTVAWISMLSTLVLSGFLAVFLVTQILTPIRKLTRVTASPGDPGSAGHEVMALSHSVHGLIKDVDHTRTELERSRERLLHSEKMAVVGKLAAEMAHSIRNPLTSIKMRLFSLEKGLGPMPAQVEDLEVVSNEMRRLDNIVGNFLEFSRPPRLRMQRIDIHEIVTLSLQLLEKKIERQAIEVRRHSPRMELPAIEADPELLKEVLINLMVNACDAMAEGGHLILKEEEGVAEHIGRAILVMISDTGHGIPEAIQDKVMDPFFSTKEEGTGLGLSIARRIVEEHGGRIEMRSREREGTTFILTLPALEEEG